MQYEHYPVDHPSGLGAGRQDLEMLISGPVAQNSLPDGVWQAGCASETAVSDHVPEVMHYYLPNGNNDDTAFSCIVTKITTKPTVLLKPV